MSVFDVISLLGGLAMFLYGMRLMSGGIKESSSGTLKRILEKVTNNPIKAFLFGVRSLCFARFFILPGHALGMEVPFY